MQQCRKALNYNLLYCNTDIKITHNRLKREIFKNTVKLNKDFFLIHYSQQFMKSSMESTVNIHILVCIKNLNYKTCCQCG